jgi:hypothetical protein
VKRRLAAALVRLSLALCAVAATLWLRSHFRTDWLTHARPGRQSSLTSRGGQLILDTMGDAHVPLWPGLRGWSFTVEPAPADDDVLYAYHPALRGQSRRFLGFAYTDIGSIGLPTRRITALVIPYWSITLALAIAPATSLLLARRRRWKQRNHRCLQCGYDLRASRERCPECGTAIDDDATNAPPSLLPLPGTPGRGLGRGASDEPRE